MRFVKLKAFWHFSPLFHGATVFTLNSVFGGQFRGTALCKEKGKEPESTMETGIRFLLYDVKISEIKKVIVSLTLVFT